MDVASRMTATNVHSFVSRERSVTYRGVESAVTPDRGPGPRSLECIARVLWLPCVDEAVS